MGARREEEQVKGIESCKLPDIKYVMEMKCTA